MKHTLIFALLMALLWKVIHTTHPEWLPGEGFLSGPTPELKIDTFASGSFKCDARQTCSQMTSCDEAAFFLKNCPGAKLDVSPDGVACKAEMCK